MRILLGVDCEVGDTGLTTNKKLEQDIDTDFFKYIEVESATTFYLPMPLPQDIGDSKELSALIECTSGSAVFCWSAAGNPSVAGSQYSSISLNSGDVALIPRCLVANSSYVTTSTIVGQPYVDAPGSVKIWMWEPESD